MRVVGDGTVEEFKEVRVFGRGVGRGRVRGCGGDGEVRVGGFGGEQGKEVGAWLRWVGMDVLGV